MEDLTPDSFMAQHAALNPDSFMAEQSKPQPTMRKPPGSERTGLPPAGGTPPQGQAMRPQLPTELLPDPSAAVARTTENARQLADALTRPPVAQSPIPAALLPEMDPKTGMPVHQAPMGAVPVLDSPYVGGQQIAGGVERMGQPGPLNKAGGAAQIIGGGLKATEPLMVASGLMAPIKAAIALGAGTASQESSRALLKRMGVADEYADLASEVVGLVGAGAAVKGGSALKGKIRETLIEKIKQRNEAAAAKVAPESRQVGDGSIEATYRELTPDEFMAGQKAASASPGDQTPKASQAASPRPGQHSNTENIETQTPAQGEVAPQETAATDTTAPEKAPADRRLRNSSGQPEGNVQVPSTPVSQGEKFNVYDKQEGKVVSSHGSMDEARTAMPEAKNGRSRYTVKRVIADEAAVPVEETKPPVTEPVAQVEETKAKVGRNPRPGAPLPDRTADTMSDAISGSSPNGRVSKRSSDAASARLGKDLFGDYLPPEPTPDESPEANLRRAKELREAAGNGLRPRAFVKEAERLEALAEQTKPPVPKPPVPETVQRKDGTHVFTFPVKNKAYDLTEYMSIAAHPNAQVDTNGLPKDGELGTAVDEELKKRALSRKNVVGNALFTPMESGEPGFYSTGTDVHPDWQRQGIGTAMYDNAGEVSGSPIHPASVQSRDAAAFTAGRKAKQARRSTEPAYGKETEVAVPGEKTRYPAKYAVMELADVQPSHNPHSFEPNANYEHQNDRDYKQPANAARVIDNAQQFDPAFVLNDTNTAEGGPTIIDPRGNALGGNNRAMTLGRVYEHHPEAAAKYRQQLAEKAQSFGIKPEALGRFKNPVLVRERVGPVDPQREITDYNKVGAAKLNPGEQAVSDGRRLSDKTIEKLTGQIQDAGEGGSLADALRGDRGGEIVNHLVKDGVITEAEKNGMVDERDQLTTEGKTRIAKALVGRMFESPEHWNQTPPEMRNKLEKIAPHVLRVEGRAGWNITEPVREAMKVVETARAHGVKNMYDLVNQPDLEGKAYNFSPKAMELANVLDQGPNKAAAAFRQYANDEVLSRDGAQSSFFEPPTQKEAFDAAFGKKAGVLSNYEPPHLSKRTSAIQDRNAPDKLLLRDARIEPIKLAADHAKTANAYVVSPHAMEYIGRITGAGKGRAWDGMSGAHLDPSQAKIAAAHADRDGAAGLSKAFKIAAFSNKSIVLVNDHPFFNGSQRSGALEHELNHSLQRSISKTGNAQEHLGEHTKEFINQRLAKRSALMLSRSYGNMSAEVASAEVGVRLMNEVESKTLPLMDDERRSLAAHYVRTLRKEHGHVAPRIIARKVFSAVRSANRGVPEEFRDVPGSLRQGRGSGAEGGNRTDSSAKDRPAERRTGDVGEGGKLASLQPTQPALFGSEEVDAANEGQKSHDAKLTGDQLTQQFKSPVTREEQLRKLKADKSQKQSSMFEDNSDKQGALFNRVNKAEKERRGFIARDLRPTLKDTFNGLRAAKDEIARVFAPQTRSASAAQGALVIRENSAELARKTDQAYAALEQAHKYFEPRDPQENYDFIDAIETDNTASLEPRERLIADQLSEILKDRRQQVQDLGSGQLRNYYENYFPHMWEKPDTASQVMKNWYAKSPMEGSKAFTKKRTIPTVKDGLEAGLTLQSDNPVDLVLGKVREMDKYLMAHHSISDLESRGLIKLVAPDAPVPDGYAPIADPVAAVYQFRDGKREAVGRYHGPAPLVSLINNHLSPGLRSRSVILRGWMAAGNALNQMQLGWSGFHMAFVSIDSVTSRLALGIYQSAHGNPLQGLKSAVTSPAAPFLNMMRGDKMLKEWYKPGSQGEQTANMVDAMIRAGGRAKMDSVYQTHTVNKMMEAFRKGNVVGGVLRIPFAATEAAAKPIMEYAVPRMKMGAFADMARYEIESFGPDADPARVQMALAKSWDSIDNRMGQLVYDNLFWHKAAKDLAMASTRSVGWNLGSFREIGGGAIDFARLAKDRDFTHRMGYVVAMPIIAGLLGAAFAYLHGRKPETVEDYFFPKDGAGKRWSMPTYMKDVYHWGHDPVGTIKGKVHPLASLTLEMLSNKDYFGKPIRNANHPVVTQAAEAAKHILNTATPMSARALVDKRKATKEKLLPMIGITPAPKWIGKK